MILFLFLGKLPSMQIVNEFASVLSIGKMKRIKQFCIFDQQKIINALCQKPEAQNFDHYFQKNYPLRSKGM